MHTTESDAELLQMMRAGDEAAFVALYQRRQGGIYRFALRMSGSEALAEDVTQEVFMALMKDNGHYDSGRGTFTAYLYGIARNQFLKRVEKDKNLQQIDEADDDKADAASSVLIAQTDPLADLSRREMVEYVRQAVLTLPANYREVVVLCDLHEMSYAEAAQALDCAVGTVRSRLHRARAMLLDRLQVSHGQGNDSTYVNIVKCFV